MYCSLPKKGREAQSTHSDPIVSVSPFSRSVVSDSVTPWTAPCHAERERGPKYPQWLHSVFIINFQIMWDQQQGGIIFLILEEKLDSDLHIMKPGSSRSGTSNSKSEVLPQGPRMHKFLQIWAHCSRLPAPAPRPHSLLHPWPLGATAPTPLLRTRARTAQSTFRCEQSS